MKKILIGISCLLVLVAFWAYADSGRESKLLPPLQVELKSGETWAFRVKNSAGTVVMGVDNEGKNEKGVKPPDPTAATFATGVTGYTVTASDGNVWLIDCLLVTSTTSTDSNGLGSNVGLYTDANVYVYLPTTITTAMDGQEMTFIKSDTGTTNVVYWAGATSTSGVSIHTKTGVTASGIDIDAQGDTVTFIADYANQIYRIKSTYIP